MRQTTNNNKLGARPHTASKAVSALLLPMAMLGMPVVAADKVEPSPYAIDKTIEDALKFGQGGKYGQVKFDLNYRYEHVDEDYSATGGYIQNADANTLRLRAGYLTPEFYGFQGYAEYEGLAAMQEDYNSTRNNLTQYSTVADPDVSELNQLWISYSGIPDTVIKGGRQMLSFDDQRFIGWVPWRQMSQTYDSVTVTNKSIPNLTATAGYIGNVQNVSSRMDEMQTPFVNLNYKVGEFGNFIGYAYWLDYDTIDYNGTTKKYGSKNSTQTYGLRFDGKYKINDTLGLVYTAEWSTQSDYESNPNNFRADRYNIMGGVNLWGVTVSGAMEQLDGGVNGEAFQTPMATLHAFQGWADKFLTTPDSGIRDVFATVKTKLYDTDMAFIYHSFQDDTGGINYGDEYDFLVNKKFGPHYHVLAKYAYYNADKFSSDTQKVWVEAGIHY